MIIAKIVDSDHKNNLVKYEKRFTILFLSISIINLAVMPIGSLYFTPKILVQIVDNDHRNNLMKFE